MTQLDDSDAAILETLRDRSSASSSEIADALGVTRQAAHARLSRLVESGRVTREGQARATRYRLPPPAQWERSFRLRGLAEDEVYRVLASEFEPIGALTGEAASTVSYVVTELVNNAIDHSSGKKVRVGALLSLNRLSIEIEDDGVGVFEHVRDALRLDSNLAAIQELSKGKTTTDPARHTGEGLFFVSKAVDLFRLENGDLAWVVDNERVDGQFETDMAIKVVPEYRSGTLVVCETQIDSVRSLKDLFDRFTQDYEFSKTRTVIKLFTIGVEFVSRSEAKRLLRGLDRFREVVLDFRGVDGIGQGFADEVFRVWARDHSGTQLIPVNMNRAVDFMVQRALRSSQ